MWGLGARGERPVLTAVWVVDLWAVTTACSKLVYSNEPPHANIRLQLQALPTEMLQKVIELNEQDKAAESVKKTWGMIALVLMLPGMALCMLGAFPEMVWTIFAGLSGTGLVIIALIIRWRASA